MYGLGCECEGHPTQFRLSGVVCENQYLCAALIAGAISLCIAAVFASPASAFVNEVRGGFYAHDMFGPAHESDGLDLTGEIVFDTPSFLAWAFNPRPRLGGTLNTNGDTSLAYIDPFGWTIDLGESPFFVDASLARQSMTAVSTARGRARTSMAAGGISTRRCRSATVWRPTFPS